MAENIKSLGQIAYEARNDGSTHVSPWCDIVTESRKQWDKVAAAVAEEVIKRFTSAQEKARNERMAARHSDVPSIDEIKEQMQEYGKRNLFPFTLQNTIPEPSLLEVVAMIYGRSEHSVESALSQAKKLIAAVREYEKKAV